MDDLCSSSSYCHGSIRHDFPGRRKSKNDATPANQLTGETPGSFCPQFRIPDPCKAFLPVVQNAGQALARSKNIRHEAGQILHGLFIAFLHHHRRSSQHPFIIADAVRHVVRQELQQHHKHAQAQGNQPLGTRGQRGQRRRRLHNKCITLPGVPRISSFLHGKESSAFPESG